MYPIFGGMYQIYTIPKLLLRFVHIGIAHYVFNMIMHLLVGVFLEMEQVRKCMTC